MKASILFCIVVVLALTACAQEKKNTAQITPKEQPKTVVMQKLKMPVNGMVCNACQSNVKKTIKSIDGVTDVKVNLKKSLLSLLMTQKK